MAPKSSAKKGKKGGNNANDDVQREAPLQAVVFADSFAETFRPITLERPKVLLPLNNVPMLEYTLEFLASSGVEEVILFCSHHAEQVEKFITTQSQVAQRLAVQCITSPTSLTAGDALREIDRQQLIQSNPFILMSADVVANVNLGEAVQEHKQRKKQDPSCVMTSLFKEIQPNCNTGIRPLNDDLVVGVNPDTSQVVFYEDDSTKSKVSLATIFLEDHAQVALRSDLMDCYIDVCSTEILLQFSEDFDYQNLRQDFYHNEVQNFELGKKFFAKILTKEFAARVMDPRTYTGVSRAILQRWVFPLVPDSNYLGPHETNYAYHRGMVYKDDNVTLSRTCKAEQECVIGAYTACGDNTTIRKSTIGRNCRIGNNVRIDGSFIWDNVVIEDDVVIDKAIICDNVQVKKGAVVNEGSILSFNTVLGESFSLPAYSKVTTASDEDDDAFLSDEDNKKHESKEAWDATQVGADGVGRLWTVDDDDIQVESDSEDEDEDPVEVERKRKLKLKALLPGSDEVVKQKLEMWDDWDSLSSSDDNEGLEDFIEPAAEPPFHQIVRDMVRSGDLEGHNIDDLFVDIKGFKFAQNKTFSDVLEALLPGLLDLVPVDDSPSKMHTLGVMRQKLEKWKSVVQKCLVGDEEQRALVEILESYCLERRDTWGGLFRYLLQSIYDLEWVEEDEILAWYGQKTDAGQETLATDASVVEFIEWLEQSEEEDSDEDSD